MEVFIEHSCSQQLNCRAIRSIRLYFASRLHHTGMSLLGVELLRCEAPARPPSAVQYCRRKPTKYDLPGAEYCATNGSA